MQNKKRELILNTMEALMRTQGAEAVSVDDIARSAGISKGSIYYYFSSKNDILDAVIERAYSSVLEKGRQLAASSRVDVFQKMEIIYTACLDATRELRRQEDLGSFHELAQNAFLHQKFTQVLITKLKPILTDILRQGIAEGQIQCSAPDETAYIVLLVLTGALDNHLIPMERAKVHELLLAFAAMQERALGLPAGKLAFLAGSGIAQEEPV